MLGAVLSAFGSASGGSTSEQSRQDLSAPQEITFGDYNGGAATLRGEPPTSLNSAKNYLPWAFAGLLGLIVLVKK